MAETLKFGPEWLRALSDGTNVASPPPSPAVGMPMYKLAEYRYGREEMLALYHPSREPPEEFKEFHGLMTEKVLQPMALIPLCEEEQRLMSQSVNSTVVLRMMGRGSGGPPARGGRGGLPDRGRGRGRGRGEGYYPRGPYDDENGPFGRGRIPQDSWEEGRGGRFDRSYPPGRTFEDDVTSPPRREFSRSMSTENWRESKKEEDEETGGDWRKAPTRDRWGGARNWREPRENYGREGYDRGKYDDYRDRPPYEKGRFPRILSTGSYDDQPEYDVPEWSTTDVDDLEAVGTFDSSGAFMSMKDKDGVEHGPLEQSSRSRSDSKEKDLDKTQEQKNQTADTLDKPKEVREKSEPDHTKEKVDTPLKTKDKSKKVAGASNVPSRGSAEKKVTKSKDLQRISERGPAEQKKELKEFPSVKAVPQKTVASESSQAKQTFVSDSVANTVNSVVNAKVKPPPVSETVNRDSSEKVHKQDEEADFDHLEKAAENLLATLGAEEDTSMEKAQVSQTPQHDALASEALPLDHEDAKKWFYRDPQGDMQGPFTSSEMAEWFSAGYFTMNLLVKRGCDERFQALGDLIKSWGRIPFLPGTSPPPLKNSSSSGSFPNSSSAPVAAGASAGLGVPGVGTLPSLLPSLSPAGLPVASMPGMPTTSMPGMPAVQIPGLPAVSGVPAVSVPGMTIPGLPTGVVPNPAEVQSADTLKAIQQQMLMQHQIMQHQIMMRQQMQMQQIIQHLQSQPDYANLPVAQLQQHALKLMLQPQMQAQMQAQAAQAAQAQQQQHHAKLSPNSSGKPEGVQRSMSVQPGNKEVPGFHRSLSQPGKEDIPESIWGVAAPETTPNPGSSWKAQALSVWDIEAKQTPAEREAAEKAAQEKAKQDERRQEELKREELRRQTEDEARKREQAALEKEKEAERLKAMERQRELERRQERQRLDQLAREQEDLRRRHEEEEVRRKIEEQKRIEEQRRQEEQRRKEEERRRQEQDRLLDEQRRILEEERLKKEMEEKIRQEEIRRRQEKCDELRRVQQQQQQEALRRMKQEQLNIQLPASAQWANSTSGATTLPSGGAGTSTGTLSITQIQQLEAEREHQEQEERRQLELQRQQMAAIQQQQQQQQLQGRSWASAAHSHAPVSSGAPSLLEIQQEQARQQTDGAVSQKPPPPPKATVPLASAGVWGSSGASSQGWAQEGAWGNQKNKASLGFWDDALTSAPAAPKQKTQEKKTALNNNSHFPSLSTCNAQATNGGRAPGKNKKSNKDEETVQRLFQALKPKDEFTRWCENALNGMQTSVDIPTFVAFLIEVESPYEVHDYVRSYLGESRDALEFGSQFLEKRSKYKTQIRQQQQPEDDIWGPAPAINPSQGRAQGPNQNNNSLSSVDDSKLSKRKKKKMQKVDQSILGFTVHAAPDRVNIGPIDSAAAAAAAE